ALTAAMVFELLCLLIGAPLPAAVGALLFALHPVQVEPVAWASGTKDLLCGFFSVAALLGYVKFANATAACGLASVPASAVEKQMLSRKRRRFHYALGLLLFVLAMLSKPTGLVVPLLAATIDRLLLRRRSR